MLSKKFALGFGIAVILPMLVYYGVSTFSPPPKWEDYAPPGYLPSSSPPPSTSEERARWLEESRKRYNDHNRRFQRLLFFIAMPTGIAAIIAGAVIGIEAIGTGLMFGGIFTVVQGYFWYWSELQPWMRFISLLLAFGVLVFIGYRKFTRHGAK